MWWEGEILICGHTIRCINCINCSISFLWVLAQVISHFIFSVVEKTFTWSTLQKLTKQHVVKYSLPILWVSQQDPPPKANPVLRMCFQTHSVWIYANAGVHTHTHIYIYTHICMCIYMYSLDSSPSQVITKYWAQFPVLDDRFLSALVFY